MFGRKITLFNADIKNMRSGLLHTDFVSFSTKFEMEWTPMLVLRLLIVVSIFLSIIGTIKKRARGFVFKKK